MYNGAARDRGDKKRQRLKPPPNEVWMETMIQNEKKTGSGTFSSASKASGVATSFADPWQGRAAPDNSQPLTTAGPSQYQHYTAASSYKTRTDERPSLYQARPTISSVGYQGRSVLTGYPGKMTDRAQGYPTRPVKHTSGFQAMTVSDTGYDQGQTIESSSDQRRTMDGEHHGRLTEAPERAISGSAAYPMRLIYDSLPSEERVEDDLAEKNPYQGTAETSSTLGKLAKEYKRIKKLPPKVEVILREQVNLDDSVLHDAFAVAMEDLIPEKEANFVAKGFCHLCGRSKHYFVPVVNFCPHADEHHSLCREHLRSVYRVRMEALFVGRNGSVPNRRLLRCLMCTRGCPCSVCIAERKRDVLMYKRYLLDTLRRSGQGSVNTDQDDRAFAEAATSAKTTVLDSAFECRLTYEIPPTRSFSDNHRYAQYTLDTASEPRPPLSKRDAISSCSADSGKEYASRRQVQTLECENERYAAVEQNCCEIVDSRMQAQQKFPYSPISKRAAKYMSTSMLNVMADSAQAADARVLAQVTTTLAPQGFVESPSAATVMNCAESEKSLVQLLSSLNQGGTTPSSTAMEARSHMSKDRQSDLGSDANGIAATSESSGNAESTGKAKIKPSTRVYPSRGRRSRDGRTYHDQSSTSSNELGSSPHHDPFSAESQSVDNVPAPKPRTKDFDANDSLAPRDLSDLASLDNGEVVQREKSLAEPQFSDENRLPQSEPGPNVSVKLPGREKGNLYAFKKETRSITTPTSSNRGPGRSRKPPPSGGVVHPVRKCAPKGAPSVKKGRGRPPRRTKQGKKDDKETEGEAFNMEHHEKQEDDESGSDSELDANLDFCEVCQGAGDLVCCDQCPRSYHLKCLHMTEDDLPEGNWQCNECKKPSRFDSYFPAVASEKTLLDKCLKIVACLKSHPFSKPFLAPVENIPMYSRVVKQPIDLSKIEHKLKKGAYVVDSKIAASGEKELDCSLFANDIRRMWSNCKLFNDDGSGITRAADVLSAGFERLFRESIEPSMNS